MFYIHGGSFEVGSGRLYDGSVLATLGVLVVTINYRLGALGTTSLSSQCSYFLIAVNNITPSGLIER